MTIYKLKLLIEGNTDDEVCFRDFWIDVEQIDNFYIPEEPDCMNIFYKGYIITVKQEKKLLNYLLDNIVNLAI